MSGFLANIQFFHFIRPWWLILLPVIGALWWLVRARATARPAPPKNIAPHLAEALSVGGDRGRRVLPIDLVSLIAVLTALAAAGPAWDRIANPFVADTAPLAVALEVSETMMAADVQPSRLERAKHKIADVIADRAGARTALIAYAGSAHRVAPLTEDPEVLKPFLDGLSPEVMPADGQNAIAALELAEAALAAEETAGAILFVLDDIDRADIAAFEAHAAAGGAPVVFLSITASESETATVEGITGASVVTVTADGADVARIGRLVASAYAEALANDDRQAWNDRGWVLAWPAALLLLLWFRQGVTMRWTMVFVAFWLLPSDGRAQGVADWFFTPDQQGRLAYEDKEYGRAAELFEDPMWRGQALYKDGQYEEAAQVFARVDTAEAAFAQGMAAIRNRAYRDGIAAFEKVLELDPGNEAAARNLEVSKAILDYVETTREQSDTGEERGIGADDVVFDNEAGRGAETQITGDEEAQIETAEQWMRSVDTRTSDYLKLRFAAEAAAQ